MPADAPELMQLVQQRRRAGIVASFTAHLCCAYAADSAAAVQQFGPQLRFFVAAPCQGRFGNKVEYFLSGLARAKVLGLAAILPPIPLDLGRDSWIPFDDVFSVQAMQEYLPGSLPMKQFLDLHGAHWPEGERVVLRGLGTHIHDKFGQRDKDRFWRCAFFAAHLVSVALLLFRFIVL